MKSAYITKTGPAKEIIYGELPKPEPTAAQVLVKVGAVCVNPIDTYVRSGMVQMPLPISAICDSGGDSIHALVRIDAESKAQWDEGRDAIKPHLMKLGADPGAMKAVNLTRLLNCRRESKKQLQRLLYLNDEPDCGPLVQKPYVYTGKS